MAVFNRFNCFTKDVTEAKHNFAAHVYKVMLTNTAPLSTNAVKADIAELTEGGGYVAGGGVTTTTKGSNSGVERVFASDVTFLSTSGYAGPFRYAVVYNATTPGNPLVGWYDYGSSVPVLLAGESFVVDFDGVNGFFTLG